MKLIRKKDGDYQSLAEIIKTIRRAEKLGASHSQIQLDPESGDYQKCKQVLLDNGYKLVKKTGNPNMTVYEVWEYRKPAKDSKKSDTVGDTPRLIREMGELEFELYRWTRTLDAQANLVKYMDDEQKKAILFNLEHLDRQIKKVLEAEKKLMSSLK